MVKGYFFRCLIIIKGNDRFGMIRKFAFRDLVGVRVIGRCFRVGFGV